MQIVRTFATKRRNQRKQPIPRFSPRDLLEKIYHNRGYASEADFYAIEEYLGYKVPGVERYDPSPERDPDVLYAEIKRLRGQITTMQNQIGKMFNKMKEK